jgi:hypothetical protein
MKKCPSCSKEYDDTMQFCMECGGRLEQVGVKCISCGQELAPGMKFCPFCGSSQKAEAPKSKPQANLAGVVLGDKNVIAGDIISGKEDYNISGNATFVKNIDESGTVVKCASCGKRMKIVDSFECPTCGAEVCEVHYHESTRDCEVCNPKKKVDLETFHLPMIT